MARRLSLARPQVRRRAQVRPRVPAQPVARGLAPAQPVARWMARARAAARGVARAQVESAAEPVRPALRSRAWALTWAARRVAPGLAVVAALAAAAQPQAAKPARAVAARPQAVARVPGRLPEAEARREAVEWVSREAEWKRRVRS